MYFHAMSLNRVLRPNQLNFIYIGQVRE